MLWLPENRLAFFDTTLAQVTHMQVIPTFVERLPLQTVFLFYSPHSIDACGLDRPAKFNISTQTGAGAASILRYVQPRRDGFTGEHKMPSDGEIDLEIALRKIHELAMADGDLGYAYWYAVGQILQRAAGMQTEINVLSKELEQCRGRLAMTA